MTQQKSKRFLENILADVHEHSVNLYTRDIYLHSNNREEDSIIDWRAALSFTKNMHILESDNLNPIIVHMHSVGGDWHDGMSIFSQIAYSSCHITIITSQAISMAGVILQAADTRILMPDSYIMVHFGTFGIEDTSKAVKSAIEINEKDCEKMINIFANRAIKGKFFKGKTLDYVRNYIDKQIKENHDWYLDAERAVELGLADGIFGSKKFKNLQTIRNLYE